MGRITVLGVVVMPVVMLMPVRRLPGASTCPNSVGSCWAIHVDKVMQQCGVRSRLDANLGYMEGQQTKDCKQLVEKNRKKKKKN